MTYSSSNNNQLASIRGTSVSYDAAGNLLVDPNTLPVSNYTWDAEARLTKITQGASTYFMTTLGFVPSGISAVQENLTSHYADNLTGPWFHPGYTDWARDQSA